MITHLQRNKCDRDRIVALSFLGYCDIAQNSLSNKIWAGKVYTMVELTNPCYSLTNYFVWMNEWCLRSLFCTVTGPGITWANEMNLVMNHAPGAGSIARPVDLQSSALPLNHGRPLYVRLFLSRKVVSSQGPCFTFKYYYNYYCCCCYWYYYYYYHYHRHHFIKRAQYKFRNEELCIIMWWICRFSSIIFCQSSSRMQRLREAALCRCSQPHSLHDRNNAS